MAYIEDPYKQTRMQAKTFGNPSPRQAAPAPQMQAQSTQQPNWKTKAPQMTAARNAAMNAVSQPKMPNAYQQADWQITKDLVDDSIYAGEYANKVANRQTPPSAPPYGFQLGGYTGPTRAEQEKQMLDDASRVFDSMQETRQANNAKMAERGVLDPEKARTELAPINAQYQMYKRKGGQLNFNDWAYAAKEMGKIGENAQEAMTLNTPEIWNRREVNNDIEQVAQNPMAPRRGESKPSDPYSFRARVARATAMGVPIAAASAYYAQQDMASKAEQDALQAKREHESNLLKMQDNTAQKNIQAKKDIAEIEAKSNLDVATAKNKADMDRMEAESKMKLQEEERESARQNSQWWDEQWQGALTSSRSKAEAAAKLLDIAQGSSKTPPENIQKILNDQSVQAAYNGLSKVPQDASESEKMSIIASEAEKIGVDPVDALANAGITLTPDRAEEEAIKMFKEQIEYGYGTQSEEPWASDRSPNSVYEEAYKKKAEDNKAKANALRKILGEERFNQIEQNYSSNNRPWGTYRTAPWWAGAQGTFQTGPSASPGDSAPTQPKQPTPPAKRTWWSPMSW